MKESDDFFCTKRIGENICCKVLREASSGCVAFRDLYFSGKNLFHIENNCVHIIHSKRKNGIIIGSCFEYWMYDGKWLSIYEIMQTLQEQLHMFGNYSFLTIFHPGKRKY